MDPVRNPFAPGAGSRPPELAGRGAILGEAKTAIERALMGRDCRLANAVGIAWCRQDSAAELNRRAGGKIRAFDLFHRGL